MFCFEFKFNISETEWHLPVARLVPPGPQCDGHFISASGWEQSAFLQNFSARANGEKNTKYNISITHTDFAPYIYIYI